MEQLALFELAGLALGATLVLAIPIQLIRSLGGAKASPTLSDASFQRYLAAIKPPKGEHEEPILEVIVELDEDEDIEDVCLEELEDLDEEQIEERLAEVDDDEYCGLRVLTDYECVGHTEEEIHPSFWAISA